MSGPQLRWQSIARVPCLLAVLFAAGCTGESDVVRVGSFLFSSVTGSNTKIPRERAAAVPYATMGLELGASAQALLILGSTMGDELDWFAGENVFVATNHGRVIRTVGLPYDLGGIRPVNAPLQNQSPDRKSVV